MTSDERAPDSPDRPACWLCGGERTDSFLGPRACRLERCRRCGLLFRSVGDLCGDSSIDPVVVSARLPLHRALLRRVESVGGSTGRLLDVGCGSGDFMILARDRGWDVEGVETSAKAVDLARARGLKVHHGVLSDVRLPDGAFDVVTLWEVLDWMVRPLPEVREIARILKDGGVLFARVRNGPIHLLIWRLGRLLSLNGLGGLAVVHRHGFSARTLKRVLDLAGFDRVRISNSRLARADAYERRLTAAGRAGSRLARYAWTALAASLGVLSAGWFLAGASLVAVGRKSTRRAGRDER